MRHERELVCADESMRLRRVGQDENDDLRARQQAVQLADGVHFRLGARGACYAQHLDVEGSEHALNLLANGAVADHQYCFSG